MKKTAQERSLLDKAYQAFNLKGKITNKLDPDQKLIFDFISQIDEKSRIELISGMNGKSITKNLKDAVTFFEKDNYLKCGQHIISIKNILLKVVEYQKALQNQINQANLPELAKKKFLDNGGDLKSLDSLRANAPSKIIKNAGLLDWFNLGNLYNLVNRDRWKKIFRDKNPIIDRTDDVLKNLNEEIKSIIKKFDELSSDLKRYDIMGYKAHSNELINQIKALDTNIETYVSNDFQPFVKEILPSEVSKQFEEAAKQDEEASDEILNETEEDSESEEESETNEVTPESVLDQDITGPDPQEAPSHESLKEPVVDEGDDELEEDLEEIVKEPDPSIEIDSPPDEVLIEEPESKDEDEELGKEVDEIVSAPPTVEEDDSLPEETVEQRKRRKYLEEHSQRQEDKKEKRKKKKEEEKKKDPEASTPSENNTEADTEVDEELKQFFPTKLNNVDEEDDLSEFETQNLSEDEYIAKLSKMTEYAIAAKTVAPMVKTGPGTDKSSKDKYEKVIRNLINAVQFIEKETDELLLSKIPFKDAKICKKAFSLSAGTLSNLENSIPTMFWKERKSDLYKKLRELKEKLDNGYKILGVVASRKEQFIKQASYEKLFETTNKLIGEHKYSQASKNILMTLPHLNKKDKRYVTCLNIMVELGK